MIQFRLVQTRNPAGNPFMPMPVVIKIANAGNTKDTSIVIYHYSPTQLAYTDELYGVGPAGDDFITYVLPFAPASATIDPDNRTMAVGSLTQFGGPLNASTVNFTAQKAQIGNW
ncbi:MAG: hypothetical protein IPL84_07515 [Chitinophagaceae bacterium]|nr:hypothetical protein [Chitinophagaceae bacterium]